MNGLSAEHQRLEWVNDLDTPEPAEGQVLVQVMSATLNPSDPHIAAGVYDEFIEYDGRRVRTGLEFSGVVARDGGGFRAGDKVYGYDDFVGGGQGAHQEYMVVPPERMAVMPSTMDFDQAACVPMSCQTVVEALRDVGELQAEERVLIIGAGGGVGTFAVQIARVLGAHVTAVAGAGQAALLRRLGAEEVIDHRATPLSTWSGRYDVVLDLSTAHRHGAIAHLLSEQGRFIPADPYKNQADFAEGSPSAASTRYLMVTKGKQPDLELVARWIEAGQVSAQIDSVFDLADIEQALARLETRGKQGRIVLRVGAPD